MIKTILNHINTQLEQLNVFTKFFTLTEKITRDGKTSPMFFEGEQKPFWSDKYENYVYHRLTGDPSFSELESTVGCGTDFNYTVPLKLVAYIKQTDQYNLHDLAEKIALLLFKSNSSALKTQIKAYSTGIIAKSFNAKSEDVFAGEFSGVLYHDSFLSVDYEVQIRANKNCLLDLECDVPDTCYVKVYDENGNILLSGTCGNNYTINIAGTSFTLLFGTLPDTGTDILDKDGNSIGTWLDESEIFIPALAAKDIDEYDVTVGNVPLRWKESDDSLNDLDDSLTTGGTLKLFPDLNKFQRGEQIKIIS